MIADKISQLIQQVSPAVDLLFRKLQEKNKTFLLQSDIRECYQAVLNAPQCIDLKDSIMTEIFHNSQEGILFEGTLTLSSRKDVGKWTYLQFSSEPLLVEEISSRDFLIIREKASGQSTSEDPLVTRV